jgi:hypothetical protein
VARRFVVASLVLVPVTLLAGCGGSSPSGPSSAPSPTPASSPTSVQETINGNVVAYGANQHALTASRAGQLRLTLSWANPAIDLDMYLTDATCNSYPPLSCTILATASVGSGSSETLTRTVASGDHLKVWVDNFNLTLPTDYLVQVVIQ